MTNESLRSYKVLLPCANMALQPGLTRYDVEVGDNEEGASVEKVWLQVDGVCSQAAWEAGRVEEEVSFGEVGSASSSSFPGSETLNQHKINKVNLNSYTVFIHIL